MVTNYKLVYTITDCPGYIHAATIGWIYTILDGYEDRIFGQPIGCGKQEFSSLEKASNYVWDHYHNNS